MQAFLEKVYYFLSKNLLTEKNEMRSNIIREKSFELGKEIVFLYQFLIFEKHEYILSKQLLRSGTSVGANTMEGLAGRSRKDFYNSLSIAYKEARETYYWLLLLKETSYLPEEKVNPILGKCDEVIRILCSILRTTEQSRK
jgi:four helix bundle protein